MDESQIKVNEITTDWFNTYVGIPYSIKGRDRKGIDCWGLVKLVYQEQFGIDLPSFSYEGGNRTSEEEAIAIGKEGWEKVEHYRSGDVVLFRILGSESHVGIITKPGYFIHAKENQDTVIERLDSGTWKHRVVGIYRYREEGSAVTINAIPNPLKMHKVELSIQQPMSLKEMYDSITRDVSSELLGGGVFYVDSALIPENQWDNFIPQPGSIVEYRSLLHSSGTGRLLATLAIVVAVAAFQQFYLMPALSGLGLSTATATTVSAITGAALTMAGTMLLNAIFPVRQPKAAKDPGTSEGFALLQGGRNSGNQYGAIPVVLGKYRFTPPLASETYVETSGTTSYLRMMLLWGYGPLQVSDLRIGDTPIANFEEVEYETLTGWNDTVEDKTRFNTLYGRDVAQQTVDANFSATSPKLAASWRTSNVVSIQTGDLHNAKVGDWCYLHKDSNGQALAAGYVTEIVDAYNLKFASNGPDGGFDANKFSYISWVERTISQDVDSISVNFNFPSGLRKTILEGGNAGKTDFTPFRARIQVRQIDPDTLNPVTWWGDVDKTFFGSNLSLEPSWFNIDNDAELEPVYRWCRISLDEHCKLVVRYGAFTSSPYAEPSGNLLVKQQEASYGTSNIFNRLPDYGLSEEPLYDICILGNSVFATIDRRDGVTIVPAEAILTLSGLSASISWAMVNRAQQETIRYGKSGEPYYKRKDAFSTNIKFNVTRGAYQVRCIRLTPTFTDFKTSAGNRGQYFNASTLTTITGYSNSKPVTPPKNTSLAMTAIRIKATDQLNGNIDGITGTVQAICKDWNGTSWVTRATRNPASLFRHVLQHPANAKKVPDSKIDLVALQEWHTYCKGNKFMFDMVVSEQRSLMDVLRDICAAGRASPTMVDGKWTIIIDKPRSSYAQFFTPHNSWGFEGARTLPNIPHGFRVQFVNAAKGYSSDERIVYSDGYSSANATLFEGLSLPGVTDRDIVFKHARFHLAQIILRPETYTLNADIENLVCSRGDLVKVTHDVPMWGLGSGRISEYVDSTHLVLDEPVSMEAGVQYTIRVRLEDGSSITRTVVAKPVDGVYSDIALTAGVNSTQGKAGNLFMFGALNEESVDCVVLGIEPANNMSARLTLVDYSPAVYDADSETIPSFDSQVTIPPTLQNKAIKEKPVIVNVISDESVMTRLSPGRYEYGIKVFWKNPTSLPKEIVSVEAQFDYANDSVYDWQSSGLTPVKNNTLTFGGVEEGETYRIRIRYVDENGRAGPWTDVINETVEGKTNPPSQPTGVRYSFSDTSATASTITLDWDDAAEVDVEKWEVSRAGRTVYVKASTFTEQASWVGTRTYSVTAIDAAGNRSITTNIDAVKLLPNAPTALSYKKGVGELILDWNDAVKTSLPVWGYEVRKSDTGWGSSGFLFKGAVSKVSIKKDALAEGNNVFYIRTIDTDNNYSASSVISVSILKPSNTSSVSYSFSDTSLTSSTVTLDWDDVTPTYGLLYYRVKYDSIVKVVNASTITLPANWIGNKVFTVYTVNQLGIESSGRSVTISKLLPNPVTNLRSQVIDNNALIFWNMPNKTTLPLQDVVIKKGATWETAEYVGTTSGTFTSYSELQSGVYTYWLGARDTDGKESSPVSIAVKINEPPDFIFYGNRISTFSGVMTNAKLDSAGVVLPVNTTETWQKHFTTRGWTKPSDQVSAGYPVFVQPGNLSGSYKEVFDFGTVVPNSKITVAYSGVIIAGTPSVALSVETSQDNSSWTLLGNTTTLFWTNFRYVRVTITVSGDSFSLYKINSLSTRLDAKLKNDAGKVSAVSTHPNGTVANFTKEFVDVTSITATVLSATPMTVVYDFQDANTTGTYVVTSNVCTVTSTGHGLIAGQKVKVAFSTGTATSGIFTVTSATSTTFTFNLTTGNTSGNCTSYWQGSRLYVFDSYGNRASATVSWAVKGY